jgi:hypothetical protein
VKRTCAVFLFSVLVAGTALSESFQPGCVLAFDAIKGQDLDVDNECGIEGVGENAGKTAENRAKNNFCAVGPVASLTFVSFKNLQKKTDQAKAEGVNFRANRELLKDIYTTTDGETVGEGSLVRVAARVLEAHHANFKKKGESVNCKRKGRPWNDVHVALVKTMNADECTSITAEISPHFRPDDWTPDALEDLQRPVRITGHLFFDTSHTPCHDGVRPNPKRQSVWEVHPVYRIEVCSSTSPSTCKVRDDSKWKDLDVWLEEHEEEIPDD